MLPCLALRDEKTVHGTPSLNSGFLAFPVILYSILYIVDSWCEFVINYPESQSKCPAFAKFLIPQYQSNDVENCLVLSPICQIRFSNLPGFNRSFLLVEIGDFLQKVP